MRAPGSYGTTLPLRESGHHVRIKKRAALVGAAVLSAVVALSGCTFGGPPSGGASESSTTLRVANPTPIASLDPLGANSADLPTLAVTQMVFETLVTRGDDGFEPSLATSWSNPDPLTWEFTMADGVEFADGTPVTAADAKASLDQLIAAKGPLVSTWAAVASVEAPDEDTFRITTSTPLGTVLSNLALLPVVPADKVADADFFAAPYGSGPFQVAEFTPSKSVELARNDNYHGEAPALETITYDYIPEVSGRVTALENDEIDVTWGLPPDQLAGLTGREDLSVQTYPTYGNYYIWFNSSREPFTDVRVRQALWYALDLETVKSALFEGVGEIAEAPIPDAVFGSAPQSPYKYDPEKAKSLLAEAGYPDGFTTTMMWSTGCCTAGDAFADAMISDWAKVGITVEPQRLERAVWLERLLALDWDSTMSTGSTITGDADFTLARLYLSTAGRMGYANPELDEILLAARQELDQDVRAELYEKAGRIIWDDAVGIFPLDLNSNIVFRSNVTGFTPTPNDLPNFAGVSID